MSHEELDQLRAKLDDKNMELLKLLNERGNLVKKIGEVKSKAGTKRFDPVRERKMLDLIAEENEDHLKQQHCNIYSSKYSKPVLS